MIDLLFIVALTLTEIHFGVPLMYYWYAKTKWLPKPWNIKTDKNYTPKVTIIIPTYREAKLIENRLDNIYNQNYPKELIEIIVIDSGSDDETPVIVEKWASKHKNINLKLIKEKERKGKANALNHALKYTTSNIVITADVDATWPSNALREALRWFRDPAVGAVSCLKGPTHSGPVGVEEGYRHYYNILRIAESKAYSTPIFHGELAAFRKKLLKKLGGFPTDIGSDDSHTATLIALMGYRSITPETLWIKEIVPRKGYHAWRIRRAQHLVQHFQKILKKAIIKTSKRNNGEAIKTFKTILAIEEYLHLANPWILAIAIILLLIDTLVFNSFSALITLLLGLTLLSIKKYRVWITQQFHLITATLKNAWSKEIIWNKQAKQLD